MPFPIPPLPSLRPKKREWLKAQVFWDDAYQRPFQIYEEDLLFARKMSIPLPRCYYIHRIQKNFAWMFFSGELRSTSCAASGMPIMTNWPAAYDERILSEEEYLKKIGD